MQCHIQQYLSSLPDEVTTFALCLLQLTLFRLYPLAGQRAEISALIFQHLWSSTHSFPEQLRTAPSSFACQKPPSSQLAGVQPASAPPGPGSGPDPITSCLFGHLLQFVLSDLGLLGSFSLLLALACLLLIGFTSPSLMNAFPYSISHPTTPARVSNRDSSCVYTESNLCLGSPRAMDSILLKTK